MKAAKHQPKQVGLKRRRSHRFSFFIFLILVIRMMPMFGQTPGDSSALKNLHQPFDEILKRYVIGTRFDYDGLVKSREDVRKLDAYINTLEKIDPDSLSRNHSLAYWINMYNAAIIRLVVTNYPVESIKDIKAWWVLPPWLQNVVKVSGKNLNLYEIENDILRPQFKDARIHFAINCASIGCPPLWNHAYTGDNIDQQLDEAAARVINDSRWVEITPAEILLTKIFEWYDKDFKSHAGSIRDFLRRYLPKEQAALLEANQPLVFFDYNWNLNKVEQTVQQ